MLRYKKDHEKNPASISISQGIQLCRTIQNNIMQCEALRNSKFGASVAESVSDMADRLDEGTYFSAKMEKALNNWYRGVSKWKKRDRLQ